MPIAFFSKKLSPAERKYSAFDCELLAVYLSLHHFRHMLEGRPFTIWTDHKPLCGALASSVDRSPQQTRHLSFIAEFTSDVRHVSGTANVVADALSCPSDALSASYTVFTPANPAPEPSTIAAISMPTDVKAAMYLADDQAGCPDKMAKYFDYKCSLRPAWIPMPSGKQLLCDSSLSSVMCLTTASPLSTWTWLALCLTPRGTPTSLR